MGWAEALAVSPGLPIDGLVAHDEGGHQAAAVALHRLYPGTDFEYVRSDTWAGEELLFQTVVLVSTFGPTTLFRVAPAGRPTVPEGMSTFSVGFQSVSMAWGVDVTGPQYTRTIALSPGVLDHAEGAPLPFEAGFSNVAEQSATYSFDDGAFARAAAEWMFGCHPLEPMPDDRVDLGSQALHAFTSAPTPAPPPEPSQVQARRGLRGLFRRP